MPPNKPHVAQGRRRQPHPVQGESEFCGRSKMISSSVPVPQLHVHRFLLHRQFLTVWSATDSDSKRA